MKTGTVLLGNCSTYGRNLRVKSSSAAGRGLAKKCRWGNIDGINGPTKTKIFVTNKKTGSKTEVLSGKGAGDVAIALKALKAAAPDYLEYSIK